MRPLNLVISAFGPYKEKVEIDFDKLGDQGIFLITGDTGSGKTTIFDAISFALFGSASGSRREVNSFRSDFASLDTPTYVHFSFIHKGIVYKIERVPKYTRKKKRGDGTTVVSGDANLFYLKEVVTGEKNVNEKCSEILGMNANQFRQIVMIAQGEFMDLLHAKPRDRAEILRHIFDTGIYKNISDELKNQFLEKKHIYEESRQFINQYIASIMWNSDIGEDKNLDNIIFLLDKQNTDDINEEKVLEEKRKVLEKELNTCIKEISEGKILEESIISYNENKSNLKILLKRENEIKEKEQIVTKNKEIWDKVINIKNSLDDLNIKYNKKIEELNNNKDTYKDICIKYEKCLLLYKKLDDYRVEFANLQKDRELYNDKLLIIDEVKLIEKELNDKKNSLDYLIYCQKQEKLDIFNKIHKLESELIDFQEKMKAMKDKYLKKHQEYLRHYDLFLSAQAGIMASNLEEGEECPVCGSKVHPKKAEYKEKIISRTNLDKELEESDNIKIDIDSLLQKINNEQLEIDKLKYEVRNIDENELINTISIVSSLFNDFNINNLEMSQIELEKEISLLEEKILDKKKNIKSFNIETIQDNIKKINNDIDILNKKINNIQKEYEEVNQEKISLETLIKVLKNECVSLNNDKKNKEKQFVSSYQELGYQTEEEYQSLLISRIEINNYDKEIQEYYDRVREVKSKISSLKLIIKNKKNVNLTEIEALKENVSSQINDINLSLKNIHSRMTHNIDLLEKIKDSDEEIHKLEKEVMIYKDLSDTANGNIVQVNKQEFEQYVQASYFDKVIDAANQRFSYMTDDRFLLVRKDEATKLNDKLGLEIEVLDYYTGKRRDIKSLSGGESFKAALSLALGMSDTIRMYSGGVVVDAMFIDEGFGSLDTASLESAISAIISLTKNKKMFGIISHVSELKSRIDRKIVVEKTNVGSNVNILL